MGREIELKIPLSDADYERIRNEICDGNEKRFVKNDEYYSRYDTRAESKAAGEPQVIRIRSEKFAEAGSDIFSAFKSYFCIKRKVIENGIELNREDETFVENADVVRDLLLFSGYHKFFEKQKNAISAFRTVDDISFHVELEIVNNLKYIEIEVTDSEKPADDVRSSLEAFAGSFALDASKRDSRSWMEILQGGAL